VVNDDCIDPMSHEEASGVRATRWGLSCALALIVTGAAGVGACGGASSATAPALAPTSTHAADVTEHHRHHHHGGVTMFIAMSLDTLGVSPEQRAAVDKIEADLYARMEPARAAEQGVLETLADGIAAGTIDSAKVSAELAELATASGGIHDASADALNQLHAALTPEQRSTLVDKVEAHWALWQHANGDEAPAGGLPRGTHLEALTAELALTPDQVEKIKANVSAATSGSPVKPDPQKIEAHLQAFGAAFKSDTFDARSLATGAAANAHLASWGATRMAIFFESVNPVLTPDQRAKLAEKVHEHADHQESPAG
jgi:Spy/CpxP family protein refolding chaperone